MGSSMKIIHALKTREETTTLKQAYKEKAVVLSLYTKNREPLEGLYVGFLSIVGIVKFIII